MNSKKVGLWEMNRSLEGPKWRWKQAECLALACGPHTFGNSDELSRRTANYLNLCRSGDDGPSRASEKYPEVATAIRVWNDPRTAEQLRILVIANCEREEIAARLQVDEQVDATIEKPLLPVPDRADCEVLLAFSLEDLAVLRVCGIPASLAAGVECLCPTDVDRLCEAFNLNRRQSARIEECQSAADEEAEEQSPQNADQADWLARFRMMDCDARSRQIASNEDADDEEPLGKWLVLVAWSPATLDIRLPSGFDAVADHFKKLEKYMGLDVSEVHVWKPTAEDLEQLQFVMRYRDVGAVQGVLLDSLYEHVQSIERFGKDQPKRIMVPADFPAAVVMLREALSADGLDCDKVQNQRDALQHVERLLHRQVVQPLMVEAMESRGASERALGLAAAHLIRMFLGQGVMINARITKRISEKGLAGLDALPVEEIKGLLEMADRVTKLFRELDRCRESTINVIQLSAMPQPKRLALPS